MLAGVRSFNNGENKARYGGLSRAEWYKSTGKGGMGGKLHDDGAPDADVIAEHPVIRTHPETGRKALYIGDQTERFAGMTLEESKPLLDYLMAHARRPEFTCRFRWRVGSLALWDNRCTMHYAVADYPGQRRVMHRLTIKGDEIPV
jgi:taurine dioxygenase